MNDPQPGKPTVPGSARVGIDGTVRTLVRGMSPGHQITIAPSDAHVTIAVNGVTVADSERPVLLDETGLPTRYYLPKEDVRTDLLRSTNFHTTCPFKGEASYWTLNLGDELFDGIAWSYEAPIPNAEGITGLLCFYPDRVEMKVEAS
jgi:uncharacterized protein (DUF427 family)